MDVDFKTEKLARQKMELSNDGTPSEISYYETICDQLEVRNREMLQTLEDEKAFKTLLAQELSKFY
jgi:hypothetical protein